MQVAIYDDGCPVGMDWDFWQAYLAAGNDPEHITHVMDTPDHHVANSAQTHYPIAGVDSKGRRRGGCIDMHIAGDTSDEMQQLVDRNVPHNIMVFIREPGVCGVPSNWPYHAHLFFASLKLNPDVAEQGHEWFHDKDGLVDRGPMDHPPTAGANVEACREAFLAAGN